jgi:hypothetical protein
MSDGVVGLLGVIVGAVLTWGHGTWSEWRERARHARYLAIRVVCILDKYIEDCVAVTLDDGYCEGRPGGEDGTAEPQVETPPPPAFPQDLDWKCIDHELMYRLLSLPRDVEAANQRIVYASENAFPPDYDEAFEERQYQYAKLGLAAFALTEEIRKRYKIPLQETGDWNPAERLGEERKKIEEVRQARHAEYVRLMEHAPKMSAPPS